MEHEPTTPPAYSSAQIAEILADLQATVAGATELETWANDAAIPVDRIVAGADLTYVRLRALDIEGSPIVLMLRGQVWQRAI